MLLKLAFAALGVVAVLYFVIVMQPATFRIARSITIAAPEDVIFSQLDDLHRWSRWNAFEKDDASITVTHTGAPSGVGASYHFRGQRAGEGRMTITERELDRRIAVRADFIKPLPATNRIEFTLEPNERGVDVTWAMTGSNTFAGKAVGLAFNLEKMIGGQFQKGLRDLKEIAEHEARVRWENAPPSPSTQIGTRVV